MSGRPETVLIAGALGLVGRAALELFEARGDVEVIGLARRTPDFATRARFLAVDLTDRAATIAALAPLRGVTRVVYAALYEKPDLGRGWLEADQIATNEAMLRNLLDALEPGNPGLRRIAVLQGTKAYGVHLGQMPIPGRESAPRHIHPNFYWAQEDLLRARRDAGASWRFTILRPQAVIGFALGSAMNLLSAIGCYAAISRELGFPLAWPGSGQRVTEATDARLLARAIAWAGDNADGAVADETFNVTNGDVLLWQDLFPPVAERFGMRMGAPHPMSLAVLMADKGAVWQRIVQRHQLRPYTLDALIGSSWQFADFAFSRPGQTASLLSTLKIRQAGFADCIDSAVMLEEWLERLQRDRVLPR
jgi:nucleoside-diphosphate-sugar epimerase